MDRTTSAQPAAREDLERFLSGSCAARTRANYRFILTRWLAWCHDQHYDPIVGVHPTALETWIADLK